MRETQRVSVTKTQWDKAAAEYELGLKHAAQIARELGVSPATVSREFKRRGCVKARRVAETVADLEAKLNVEAKRKAKAEEAANERRAAAINSLVGELMAALTAADKAGDLTMANPEISRIDRELRQTLYQD
jgi:IS30 family transposase